MTTRADRINYLITKVQRDVHRLEKLGRLTPQEATFIRSKLVHQNDKACNATLPELSSPYFTLGVPVISIKAQSGYEHELKFERSQLLIVTDLDRDGWVRGFNQKDETKSKGLIRLDAIKFQLRYLDEVFYSVDEYSKATPESQAQDVTTLSHYLTQPYPNDPISQLRSIYSWIAYHITYDVDEFFKRKPGGKKTPQAVLKDRTTVCAGYAILFEALCLANRDLSKLVQPRQVSGYGRGYGASTEMAQIPRSAHGYSNHAWNSVRIEGKMYLIESTWGSGFLNQQGVSEAKFEGGWFLCPPEEFIYSHFPTETSQQYLNRPLSEKEFCRLPQVGADFFKFGVKLISHPNNPIVLEPLVEPDWGMRFILEVDPSCILTASIVTKEGETQSLLRHRDPSCYYRIIFYLIPSAVKIQVFLLTSLKATSGSQVLTCAVKQSQLSNYQIQDFLIPPTIYNETQSLDFILVNPKCRSLTRGSRQSFIINFAGKKGKSVELVLMSPSNRWLHLKSNGTEHQLEDILLDASGSWTLGLVNKDVATQRTSSSPLYGFDVV